MHEKQRIKIIIITYNISSLVTLQCKCIEKFCRDLYEIVVIDNSTDLKIAEEIKYHATQAGCEYIKTNASSSNGSASHSFAANLSYLMLKDFQGVMVWFDHDLFAVKEFSASEVLNGKLMAGIGQARGEKTYYWPGCLFVQNDQIDHALIDFSPNDQYQMDTGGNLYKAIDSVGKDNCTFLNESYEQNPQFTKSFYNFYSMINNGTFLHGINASNWSNAAAHEERINSLINIVKEKAGLS